MRRLSHLPTLKLHVSAAIITFSHSFMRPSPSVCVCLQMIKKGFKKKQYKTPSKHFCCCFSPLSVLSVSSRSRARPHPNRRLRPPLPSLHSLRYHTFTSSIFSPPASSPAWRGRKNTFHHCLCSIGTLSIYLHIFSPRASLELV